MHGESGYARRDGDAYFTEPRVTEALCYGVELRGPIWEPAAGRGDMAKALVECGYQVYATDIAPADPAQYAVKRRDFLEDSAIAENFGSIVTNPPYDRQDEFIERALWLARALDGMVAMLLRNECDSAKSRWDFFAGCTGFRSKLVLTFRPRWDWWETDKPKASPRHNFAWFVWDFAQDNHDAPTIGWLP